MKKAAFPVYSVQSSSNSDPKKEQSFTAVSPGSNIYSAVKLQKVTLRPAKQQVISQSALYTTCPCAGQPSQHS